MNHRKLQINLIFYQEIATDGEAALAMTCVFCGASQTFKQQFAVQPTQAGALFERGCLIAKTRRGTVSFNDLREKTVELSWTLCYDKKDKIRQKGRKTVKYCPKCHAPMEGGTSFCTNCGAPVPTKKFPVGIFVSVVAVVLVLALAVSWSFGLFGNDPIFQLASQSDDDDRPSGRYDEYDGEDTNKDEDKDEDNEDGDKNIFPVYPGGAAGSDDPGESVEPEGGSVYYLNFRPELDTVLQRLAETYTGKTGIEVKVVSASYGSYADALVSSFDDVTVYNIGDAEDLADWGSYALDLTDSAIAKELITDDFNLYNEAGELKAIGNYYESYGIIVNTKLLAEAGYSLDDITNYETLKSVCEDIHARAAELGFDAFTTSGLAMSSAWRFSGHLASLPLHYEGVKSQVAAITGEHMDLFKNVWDLYINNAAADPASLTAESDAAAEFKAGEAVFYQNGTWEYSGLIEAGMTDDQLAMIPIYCGAEGEENIALCSGTENHWAISSKASAADQQASIDFLVWLVTDPDASAAYVSENACGGAPFKDCLGSPNKFVADGNAMLAADKTSISWAFIYTPNVDAWRATVVTALAGYSAGTADWSEVVNAFVEGWAYEYAVANG